MNSSDDIEIEPQVPLVDEENATGLKQMPTPEQGNLETNDPIVHDDNQNRRSSSDTNEQEGNEVTLQTPPPSYSMLKQEAILVEKLDINGKK